MTRPKIKTQGYKPWEESDVAVYKARHPSGTLARLALELLLCTGQRRKDIVGMGRQHVRGDMITVRQHKTGTVLAIPINRKRPTIHVCDIIVADDMFAL